MQLTHQEKLKALIEKSSILSATERSEWLVLLELMDDKQAAELERILTATGSAGQEAPKTPSQPVVAAQQAATPSQKPPAVAGASFSHIMNFPNVPERSARPGPAKTLSDNHFQQPNKPIVQGTTGGVAKFAARLKNIFAEKELPPGHAEPVDELELPPGQQPQAAAPARKPSVAGNPLVGLKKTEEGGKGLLREKTPPIVPKPSKSTPVPAQASALANKPQSPVLEKLVAEKQKVKENQEKTPGLDVQKLLEKQKAAMAKTAPSASPDSRPSGKPLVLDSLKDVVELGISYYRHADLKMLEQKLHALVRKQGYHEVLFSLEQSPLYKAYLDTGTKLLKEQTDFETLRGSAGKGLLETEYLSREEFENFADLLRQLQAG